MTGDEILMRFPFPYGVYRYVAKDLAMEACKLGWMSLQTLRGTHHGEHAVHMVWLCTCPMRLPA